MQLLVVVSVASGTDLLVSAAFTFLNAAKAGRVHAALHVVSLVCEIGILTGTVLLQQHGSHSALVSGIVGGKSARADRFLILSGLFNLVTFGLNMVGLSNVINGSGLCVRRIKAASNTLSRSPPSAAGLLLATGLVLRETRPSLESVGSMVF